jgi:hypothetical protein
MAHVVILLRIFVKFTCQKILLCKNNKPAAYDPVGRIMTYKSPWCVKLNWISCMIMDVAGRGHGLFSSRQSWKNLDGRFSVAILSKAL